MQSVKGSFMKGSFMKGKMMSMIRPPPKHGQSQFGQPQFGQDRSMRPSTMPLTHSKASIPGPYKAASKLSSVAKMSSPTQPRVPIQHKVPYRSKTNDDDEESTSSETESSRQKSSSRGSSRTESGYLNKEIGYSSSMVEKNTHEDNKTHEHNRNEHSRMNEDDLILKGSMKSDIRIDSSKKTSHDSLKWPRPVSQYFSLSEKVDHLPLSHLLTPPFSIDSFGVCESIGPPLVVCLTHTVLGLSESGLTRAVPNPAVTNPAVPSPMEHGVRRRTETRLDGVKNRRPDATSNSSKGLSNKFMKTTNSRENSSDDHMVENDQIIPIMVGDEESIDTLYVSPYEFSWNARQVFGELPPSILGILMTAWTTMMKKECEQVISLFGNNDRCESSIWNSFDLLQSLFI